jgi:WXG100 family type VII secretion target
MPGDKTIRYDFNAISSLHATLAQEAANMRETLATVLGATNDVGSGWSGHAYDQFSAAITDWQQYGQRLAQDLTTLSDLMQQCAESFKSHDEEFAAVWNSVGR